MSDTTLSVGAPAETLEGERRVALTPAVVPALLKLGARVVIESGAGEASGFPDEAYADKGATIGSREEALGRRRRGHGAGDGRRPGQPRPGASALRAGGGGDGGAAWPRREVAAAIAARGATLFSLELVPRTSRAQSMDVLSSQAIVAGYKAVMLAAEALPKMFPLMTTAAGTVPPSRVFVIGAGRRGPVGHRHRAPAGRRGGGLRRARRP